MESGTARERAVRRTAGIERWRAARPRIDRGPQPGNGATIGSVAIDSPASVAETVARVRANQAEWEALGIEGRYHWLGKLRDWLLDNDERVLDTMQAETGKVRADARHEPVYLADLINFYGAKAAKFIGDETVRPHSPLVAVEEADGPVPALPRGRRRSAPGTSRWPGAGRRDPGPAGGRRGGRQALRVHAARPRRDRQGLEGGDRRARRVRLRARDRRDRRRSGRQRSTSSSSPARTAPGAR